MSIHIRESKENEYENKNSFLEKRNKILKSKQAKQYGNERQSVKKHNKSWNNKLNRLVHFSLYTYIYSTESTGHPSSSDSMQLYLWNETNCIKRTTTKKLYTEHKNTQTANKTGVLLR